MTAPPDDIRHRAAYAACKEAKGKPCNCARLGIEPCPQMLMAACAVERVLFLDRKA